MTQSMPLWDSVTRLLSVCFHKHMRFMLADINFFAQVRASRSCAANFWIFDSTLMVGTSVCMELVIAKVSSECHSY